MRHISGNFSFFSQRSSKFSDRGFAFRVGLLVAALLVSAGTSVASTTTLQAVSDAYISASSSSTNFGSATTLLVGNGNSALVQFDISSLIGVPPASVSSATFSIWVAGVTTSGAVDLFAVSSAWSESTVTFNTQPTTGALQASNVAVFTSGFYITLDITPLLKSWIVSPATNDGLEIKAAAASPTTSLSFASRENAAVNEPPLLTVTTTAAQTPEPGTFALFGSGLVGLAQLLRRRHAQQ